MPKKTRISERNTAKKKPELAVISDPNSCITSFSPQEKTNYAPRDLL